MMDLQNWNVVVSVHERCYQRAHKLLAEFGDVRATDFYNVLLLKVDSRVAFLLQLQARSVTDPSLRECLGHVVPAFSTFIFQSPEEFESRAKRTVAPWLPVLADKTFHVRMHRRGFKSRLSSQREERFLDHYLLEQLHQAGSTGQIGFIDPDVIIAVETVAQWAGLSYWTRDDLRHYSFLKLD